jgi:hypothetical protein
VKEKGELMIKWRKVWHRIYKGEKGKVERVFSARTAIQDLLEEMSQAETLGASLG